MSQHLNGPTAMAHGRLNPCDLYVFAGGPGCSVLLLTVNPEAGRWTPLAFRPDAVYRFAVDTSSGTKQDLGLRVRFDEPGLTDDAFGSDVSFATGRPIHASVPRGGRAALPYVPLQHDGELPASARRQTPPRRRARIEPAPAADAARIQRIVPGSTTPRNPSC